MAIPVLVHQAVEPVNYARYSFYIHYIKGQTAAECTNRMNNKYIQLPLPYLHLKIYFKTSFLITETSGFLMFTTLVVSNTTKKRECFKRI